MRKTYYMVYMLGWLYTIAWLVSLFLLWYYWDTALWFKIGVNFILIVFTPTLRNLAKPYGQYKIEWEKKQGKSSG